MGDHEIQPQQRSICSISQAAQPREAVDMTHIEHPARWKVVDMPHIAGRARRNGGRYATYRRPRTLESGRYATYRRPRTSDSGRYATYRASRRVEWPSMYPI